MANTYYICSREAAPVLIDLANDRPVPDADLAYFLRAFRLLERCYAFDNFTICFAWGATTRIPRIGPDVIAVIYGDEQCRVPAYVNQVYAVIKSYGLFPVIPRRMRPLRLAQIEVIEFLRNLMLWAPTGWRWLISKQTRSRCHLVPSGYGIPAANDPLPFDERSYITSFLGSVTAPKGLLRLIGTPKSYCRSAMMRSVRTLAARYGDDKVVTSVTAGFLQSLQDDGKNYHRVMAQTKICVAPRGTARETQRVFDGLKFGCVVIADQLPQHPFYRGSPIIQIADWPDLPDLVERLLADPHELRRLSDASFRWWNEVVGERALAKMMAHALNLVPRAEQPVVAA